MCGGFRSLLLERGPKQGSRFFKFGNRWKRGEKGVKSEVFEVKSLFNHGAHYLPSKFGP